MTWRTQWLCTNTQVAIISRPWASCPVPLPTPKLAKLIGNNHVRSSGRLRADPEVLIPSVTPPVET